MIVRFLILLILPGFMYGQCEDEINLQWVWKDAVLPAGVSWGVPFKKGKVDPDQRFILMSESGDVIPLDSWPMAYWPDGSLKWGGFATVASPRDEGLSICIVGDQTVDYTNKERVTTEESSEKIKIATGAFSCDIYKKGSVLLDSILMDGMLIAEKSKLIGYVQEGPSNENYNIPAINKFSGTIDTAFIEQSGSVRTVIRIKGIMNSHDQVLLPFDIRLYFYSGSHQIRMVYNFIYDGNEEIDFIKGIGFVFSVPMTEEPHNRHVRFAGENPGIWAEPVRPLVGRRTIYFEGKDVFSRQHKGEVLPDVQDFDSGMQNLIKDLPIWNDYRLEQLNSSGFAIKKRTQSESAWIEASSGARAGGLAYVGDIRGGMALGIKDFWQTYPVSLEIKKASKNKAEIYGWLWSPEAEAMDLRHYDTIAHGLQATYEDVQEGLSTPHGIAHTSELNLFFFDTVPSNEHLSQLRYQSSHTPLLSVDPQTIYDAGVFGVWSLPDTSTQGGVWIENRLNKIIRFYQKEIDQRNWYGFWDYGDVMHSYDPIRHSWMYDIGGYAWDNTELATPLWLWYSYIRSGNSDIFRMAEAMSRHTSEVDVYHLGDLKGLGSRHNVRHWGDGSKEVRESQALYHRIYYYLTTDERIGDIMEMVAEEADIAMTNLDPLRLILPKSDFPTHIRFGPDWLALAGNWMIQWERTNDDIWRDKINRGIESFSEMPYGFFSGLQGAFGYDPSSKYAYALKDSLISTNHLSVLMGGPEVAFELTELIDNPKWNALWYQFCTLYGAPREEIEKVLGRNESLGRLGPHYARLPAYAYFLSGNQDYATLAWKEFLNTNTQNELVIRNLAGVQVYKEMDEMPNISSNNAAQWSLNAIELLELARDFMPAENELWQNK